MGLNYHRKLRDPPDPPEQVVIGRYLVLDSHEAGGDTELPLVVQEGSVRVGVYAQEQVSVSGYSRKEFKSRPTLASGVVNALGYTHAQKDRYAGTMDKVDQSPITRNARAHATAPDIWTGERITSQHGDRSGPVRNLHVC